MIAIRLRNFGQVYFYAGTDFTGKEGDHLILEHDRGTDYGVVVPSSKELVQREHKDLLKKIIRLAGPDDFKQIEENKKKAKEAFGTCQKKIEEHKLEMKLVEAEYSFDRSKIIFYFTAEGRVDFRNLVKDLAKIFKARIELRQIGPRDEAKLFGGFGPCGRELCCVRFLKDFEPVTVKMVKEEGLPLNRPKVSGLCDRLMCCLSFEYETYKLLSAGLPKEGEKINTPQGKGKVISVNVFKRAVSVELEEGGQTEIIYK